MLTVVETSAFARRAEKPLSTEQHEELLFQPSIRKPEPRFRARAGCERCAMRREAKGNPAECG
jgi:hypothetical protein